MHATEYQSPDSWTALEMFPKLELNGIVSSKEESCVDTGLNRACLAANVVIIGDPGASKLFFVGDTKNLSSCPEGKSPVAKGETGR